MGWFQRKKKTQPAPQVSAFSTEIYKTLAANNGGFEGIYLEQPTISGVAMDSIDGSIPIFKGGDMYGVPEAQACWYASQSFIGYNMCALISKNWLVDKACNMPARDAIRQGYNINCDDQAIINILKKSAKRYHVNRAAREFIHLGRVFGGRIALFVVESTDPDYYEKPFNLDGVAKGSYKGISQIDPQWITPDLIADNIQDPASLGFYEPTYYMIGSRRYHKTHLIKFIPYPVPDVLKPQYNYFGVSVPERIYERVYAAERTANEAPQLAMTKRMLTMGIPDIASADKNTVAENMQYFLSMRDNYGVNVSDADTVFNQFDTSLADLDATIMTQYQLVAAASGVPATKLLGTTPKGFNATGEYDEASYHEDLESIQSNDLEEFLQRHYQIALRNAGLSVIDIDISWQPLDSPTAGEYADIELKKAQTDQIYVNIGAIDGEDIFQKISTDKESSYFGLERPDGFDESDDLGDEDGETDPLQSETRALGNAT
ncbi:MAG: DUF1073 domain-containing protein [Enterobacteriaceae bacterium]|jgi:phage-related protein (TIGR01555 family)|nr:DUF1073 domain-containing protein [Enterobacteriaceae bacterium]